MRKIITAVRVTEIDAFSDTALRLYKADDGIQKDEFLKTVMAELEELSAKITSAILQDKVTSSLDQADSARDEALRNLGKILTGYSAFPIPAKQEAAFSLLEIFDKYKKITSENYASESSLIESLLQDLNTSEAKLKIAELEGVEQTIEQIRSTQDVFNAANDKYIAASTTKGVSATEVKKSLLSFVNAKMIAYLDAMNLANKAVYGTFISKIEAEIERVNATVAKRGK